MDPNLGQQLREAREARSLSLEQVNQATRIRMHYLRAMEAGDFDAIPSQTQARGFLRAYAAYLKLNPDPLLANLDGVTASSKPFNLTADSEKNQKTSFEESRERTTFRSQESNAIFVEIGQRLKEQRELLGLTLDDVERHTHLRTHHLSALESGNLTDLPSPVQGRGMLKNYSSFLGMDTDQLLLRFAEALQVQLASRQATRPPIRSSGQRQRAGRQTTHRLAFLKEFFFAGMVIAFLASFVIWGAIKIADIRSSSTPEVTAPSISDVLLQSTLLTPLQEADQTTLPQTPSPPGDEAIPPDDQLALTLVPIETDGNESLNVPITPTLQIPASSIGAVQVYTVIRQRTWMRAIVDGEVEFQGRAVPGSAYTFAGDENVEVLTGNGSAVQIFFNQADLGLMGAYGEVVDRVFTIEGPETPTPSPTISPTDET